MSDEREREPDEGEVAESEVGVGDTLSDGEVDPEDELGEVED